MNIKFDDIISNDYILSNDSFKWIEFNKKIDVLKSKYSNLLDRFTSFDGFAFPSREYVTRHKDLQNKTKLIQISNVNDNAWLIIEGQKFEYLPNSYIQNKKKYLLDEEYILISLTGGSNLEMDISSYFDNSFNAFLNQRISAFKAINKKEKDLYFYFYGFTKSLFFKEQWLGRGGIQKNTGTKERKNTFIPELSDSKLIKYISFLTQSIINKEKLIRNRHDSILKLIHNELIINQKSNTFNFKYPTYNEINSIERMDTNLYREDFKKIDFSIKNYKNGFQSIFDLGFSLSRGQNLQVSNIGKSIYSNKHFEDFYTLMLPKHLSKYGTVDAKEFIGNAKELKTLKQGDLIFGAEGFEKGRSIVIVEEKERTITNIHGITIQQEENDLTKAIFVKCFLDYLRDNKIIDLFAVGGNGGSLAQKYWHYIPFPKFDVNKQKELAKLYFNPNAINNTQKATLDNYLDLDNAFNEEAGIYELDKSVKAIKEKLNKVIDQIVNDNDIEIDFNYL
ncbi:hypothetical protein C8N46_106329 [Kordia periserrulae]|uniref:Type I restriction enzyme S subunit n=1 Tax=Kordia periserrulae TaxID=701523 RepID=A0A2T6BXA2_9FLAO|nr:hypothetical protein [Kordia periserrulae]PTX60683.1 hypothetical protein C8N46_106329 [Kordia periserrulae]